MKTNNKKYMLIMLFACISHLPAFNQVTPKSLQQYIEDKQAGNAETKEFYTRLNYKTAWIQKENRSNLTVLFNALKECGDLGLQEKDYQFNYIESLESTFAHLQNTDDSLNAEISITHAALHFYSDIAYGNTKPFFGYNGLHFVANCSNIPIVLADCVTKNILPFLISKLSATLPEATVLTAKIKWYNNVMAITNFTEVIISSNNVNSSNKPLMTKLYQLGFVGSVNTILPDSSLKQKIREVQQQFNLPVDGLLHATVIQQLNVPISVRLQQLSFALNYYRWLNCVMKNESVIVVNIPAAYLKVYRNDKTILEMRVIAGKKSTPTPTLTSRLEDVILYPYWHVPSDIVTREMLPAIKRNPGYINTGNYQVLNKEGKIMNPRSINWHSLSAGNFPYVIRQSTGCDNSLGLLKLDFNSPFEVYLHDTPGKTLFKKDERHLSHGCMRMEKPMELGRLVLKNNAIAIDTLEQKGCLRNQSPITVHADDHMPVIVWYNPAGTDNTGRLIFYQDVYGKFDWLERKNK